MSQHGGGSSLEDSIDAQVKQARKEGTLRAAPSSPSNIQDID